MEYHLVFTSKRSVCGKRVLKDQRSDYRGRVDFNPGHSGWEIIAEDESKEADQHGSLANLDSSPGTSGHKMGHGSSGK